jgi:hypothetical protein
MGIPLRIAEPTGRYMRSLRRFRFSDADVQRCIASSYCNASVDIGEVTDPAEAHGDNWPHDDTRWPTTCESCQRLFMPSDQWQRNDNQIYQLSDGTEFVFRHSFGRVAPAGTMIRAAWYDEYTQKQFELGELTESWLIALPDGGEWITTQKATSDGHWVVTGTPPNITATPSIFHNSPTGWHGFVTNGELVTC